MEGVVYRSGIWLDFHGEKARKDITRMQKTLGNFKRFVSLAFAGKVIKDMAEFGKSIHAMSLKTGTSVERLSSLRNAFIAAGSSASSFEKTVSSISSGLRGLSMGRGEFAAKLGMLGISPYTESGALKSESDVLYDIADWAKSQEGFMSKQDILYRLEELFGIDAELGEKLLEGGEAFKKFQDDAKERMGTIDDEASKKLTSLANTFSELFATLKNSAAILVSEFAPAIETMTKGLQKLVKVIGDYKEVFATLIAGFFGLKTIMMAISGIASIFGAAASGVAALSAGIIGLIGAISGILGYLGGKLLAWFMKPDQMEKNNKTLDEYRDPNNYTKIDLQKLRDDFASGKISKENDERQYYTALNMLRSSFGGRYSQLWDIESSHNAQKIAEYGYNPFLDSYSESLFQPTNVEQAARNGDQNITNTKNVTMTNNFNGPVTQDVLDDAGKTLSVAVLAEN